MLGSGKGNGRALRKQPRPGQPNEEAVVNESSASLRPYALVRVHPDGREEPVSDHASFEEGWSAGQEAVHEHREAAYALYIGRRRIARFCHHRIAVSSKSFDWSVLS